MTTLEKIRAEIKTKYDSIPWRDNDYNDGWVEALEWVYDDVIGKYAEQEPRLWNNHQVACLLADMFGDNCACNYNGIDEWLPKLCDFKDNCCPNPIGVACWEQFLKHSRARYCECGYEMR